MLRSELTVNALRKCLTLRDRLVIEPKLDKESGKARVSAYAILGSLTARHQYDWAAAAISGMLWN